MACRLYSLRYVYNVILGQCPYVAALANIGLISDGHTAASTTRCLLHHPSLSQGCHQRVPRAVYPRHHTLRAARLSATSPTTRRRSASRTPPPNGRRSTTGRSISRLTVCFGRSVHRKKFSRCSTGRCDIPCSAASFVIDRGCCKTIPEA